MSQIGSPALTRNVAAFSTLLRRLVERDPSLPGLGVFYGHSGLGKSISAAHAAVRARAIYVEAGQFTTAKSLLVSILKIMGMRDPRGSTAELVDECIRLLSYGLLIVTGAATFGSVDDITLNLVIAKD